MKKHYLSSFEEFKATNKEILNVHGVGFDLIINTVDGDTFVVKDGVPQLIADKGSLTLSNGSHITYQNIVDSIIKDNGDLGILDTEWVGDAFTRKVGEKTGLAIPTSAQHGTEKFSEFDPKLISRADSDKIKHLEEQNESQEQKNIKQIKEISQKLEQAKQNEKNITQDRNAETNSLIKDLAKDNVIAKKHHSHVSDMQNKLEVKEVVINDNTSKLTGEFNTPPAPISDNDGTSDAEETQPDVYSLTMSLRSSSDTGIKGDFITSQTAPNIAGGATPNSTLTILVDDTVVGTTVASAAADWSFKLSELNEGDHKIVVKDSQGRSVTHEVTIDTKIDLDYKLSNDSGIDGDMITKNNDLKFIGKTDPNSKVTVEINGHSYTTKSNASGSWSVDCSDTVTDGKWEVSITSVDAAGNTISKKCNITVDTKVTASISMEGSDDTGLSDHDSITQKNENIHLSGSIESGAKATLLINGIESPIVIDGEHWTSVTTGSFNDGTYKCTIKVTDIAGNTKELTDNIVIDTVNNFTGGLSASSDTGSSNSDGLTSCTKPTFSGTGEPMSTVSISINNVIYNTSVDNGGNWVFQLPTELNNDTYSYKIVSTDVAGNIAHEAGKIIIDNGITLVSTLLTDSGISNSDNITNVVANKISGTTDSDATVKIFSASIPDINGTIIPIDGNGKFVFNMPSLPQGTYDYTIESTDMSGNTIKLQKTLVIDTEAHVSVAMTNDSDTGLSDSDMITSEAPVFKGNGDPDSKITLTFAGKEYSTTSDSKGNWQIPIDKNVPDGTYIASTSIEDIAGNVSKGNDLSVKIDTEIPSGFTIHLNNDSGDSKNDWLTKNGALDLSGKVDAGCSIEIRIGEIIFTKENGIHIDADGNWGMTMLNPLVDGKHSITTIIYDEAGNKLIGHRDVIVDSVVSVQGELSSKSDSGKSDSDLITNHKSLIFNGTSEIKSRVELILDGVKHSVKSDPLTGKWEIDVDCDKGEHTYVIQAEDAAGNIKATEPKSILIDTDKPENLTVNLANDSGISENDFITMNNKIVLNGSSEKGCSIEITLTNSNGQESKFASPESININKDGTWSFSNSNQLPDGKYTVDVTESDVAGNTSTISKSITIDTMVDLTESMTKSSDTGFNNHDKITNNTTPTIHGQTDPNSTVSIKIAGGIYKTVADEAGSWSIKILNPITESSDWVDYIVTSTDIAGNTTTKNDHILVDTHNTVSIDLSTDSDSGNIDCKTNLSPVFVGKGEPDSHIALTINGQTYSTIVDKSGNWKVEVSQHLDDNSYPTSVESTDVAGNKATAMVTITIDTKNTVTGDLDNSSDSGTSATDRVTNSSTPKIIGTTDPDSVVSVVINGRSYTTTADKDGKWNVVITDAINDGTIDALITSIDPVGNKASTTAHFTIDTKNFIDIALSDGFDTGISNVDHLTSKNTPEFDGQTDPNSKVTMHIGKDTYEATADINGLWHISNINPLSDGNYKIRVSSIDVAGNESLNDSFILQIDTKAPVFTKTSLRNDSGDDKHDFITNDGHLIFTGKVENSNVSIKFEIGGKSYSSPSDITVDSDGSWQFATPNEVQDCQNQSYKVTYTDKAGNQSFETGMFTVDTHNTIEASLNIASDSGIQDGITNISTPIISGKTDANAKVTVIVEGKSYNTTADDNGDYNVALGSLSEGKHDVFASSVDIAGNKANCKTEITIDKTGIDLGNLSLISDSGVVGDWKTHAKEPVLGGHTEANSSLQVNIDNDDGTIATLTSGKDFNIEANGKWQCKIPSALQDGVYTVHLTAIDVTGNKSTFDRQITIDSKTHVQANLDSASDSGISDSDGVTNSKKIVIIGTSEINSKIEITAGGHTYNAETDKDGKWDVHIDSLNEGSNTVTVTSTDDAGNTADTSVEIDYDTTSPDVGTIILDTDTGVKGDWKTNSKLIEFSGKVGEGCSVDFEFNGKNIDNVKIDKDGAWVAKVDASILSGDIGYTVKVTDQAGNSSEKSQFLNIDRVNSLTERLSAISDLGSSNNDGLTNTPNPIFNGETDPNSTVVLHIAGNDYKATSDNDGKWSITVGDDLKSGSYSYTVTSTDDAGNVITKNDSIIIDRDKPSVDFKLLNDTGFSDSDWDSKDTKPVLSGSIEEGASVVVSIDGVMYDSNTISITSDGKWLLASPLALSNDSHNVTVTITDAAGNKSIGSKTLIIDTNSTIKQAILDSSTDSGTKDGHFTNITKPSFSGISESKAKITLSINNHEYTTTANTDGTWKVDVKDALSNGEHDWTISSEDIAGNTSSIKDSITIDNKCEITVDLTTASDTGTFHNDNITKDATPTWHGVVDANCDKVTVDIDGIKHTVEAKNGTFDYTPTDKLSNATHHVVITAESTAFGNETVVEKDVTVDTIKPVVADPTLVGDSGTFNNDYITNQKSFKFTGQVTNGDKLVISIGGIKYDTDNGINITDNGDGTSTWDMTVASYIGDGEFPYSIRVTDLAGNIGLYNGLLTVDRENSLSASVVDEDGLKSDATIRTQNPSFFGHTDPLAVVTVTIDDQEFTGKADEQGKWKIATTGLNLEDAEYNYTVQSTDLAGNIKYSSSKLTVDTETTITGGLSESTDSGASHDDGITNSKQIVLNGDGEKNSKLVITIDNHTYESKVDNYGRWSFKVPYELNNGDFDYTVKATDPTGNTKDLVGKITIDRENFLTSSLTPESDTGFSKKDYYTSVNHPYFEGTTAVGSLVSVTINGGEYKVDVNADGTWKFTPPYLLDVGDSPFIIKSVDIAGNEIINRGTLVVDVTTSITSHLDQGSDTGISHSDNLTNSKTPTISGKGEAGAHVTLSINNHQYDGVVKDDGTWAIQVKDEIGDGKVDYSVDVVDRAGNKASDTGSFTIDTTVDNTSAHLDSDSDSSDSSDNITNINTPTIIGTCEIGSTVIVHINGKSYDAKVDGSGSWSATTDKISHDGEIKYTAEITDKAGNIKIVSNSFTLDTKVVLTGGLDPESDTGTSHTDNYTSQSQPILKGTTDIGASVWVVFDDDPSLKYTATVEKNGSWTCNVAESLSDGQHHYTIYAEDIAGNTTSVPNKPIFIDTSTSVNVELNPTSDSNIRDNITNSKSIQLDGQAEKDATVVIHVYSETIDQTFNGKVDANGHWTLDLPKSFTSGEYTVDVSSTDKAGNKASDSMKFVIDREISLTYKLGTDDGVNDAARHDGIIKCRTPEINGTGEPDASIVVKINGESLTTTVDETGHWKVVVNTPLSEDGEITYTVSTKDTAGNTISGKSGSFILDTQTDMTIELSNDSMSKDNITRTGNLAFKGTGEIGGIVEITVGGKTYDQKVDSKGNWSIKTPDLTEGDYNVSAKITDKTGNVKKIDDFVVVVDKSTSSTISLDTNSDTGSSHSDLITSNSKPRMIGEMEDGATVTVTAGGFTYTTDNGILIIDSTHWALSIPNALNDGHDSITVNTIDIAGNRSSATINILVDTKAPVSSVIFTNGTSATNAELTSNKTPSFNGVSEKGAIISVFVDGELQSEHPQMTNGHWTFTCSQHLSDATHKIRFEITDVAGNTEVQEKTVIVDTVNSVTARLKESLDHGSSNSDYITNEKGNIIIVGNGEADSSITMHFNGKEYTTTVDKDGNWSIDVGALSGSGDTGTKYDYTVSSTDLAGNIATTKSNVVIDHQSPNHTVITLEDDAGFSKSDWKTNSESVVINGTTSTGSTSKVLVDNIEIQTGLNKDWSLDLGALEKGTHKITVETTDVAGNTTIDNKTVDINRDLPLTAGLSKSDDTGVSHVDGLTNKHKLQFSGVTGEHAKVSIKITDPFGNDSVANVVSDDAGHWIISSNDYGKQFDDGTYTYTVTSDDVFGNSKTVSKEFTIDSSISANIALDGLSNTGSDHELNLTNQKQPRLTGKLDSSLDHASITVTNSAGSVVSTIKATVDDDGVWKCDINSDLKDGDYTAVVTATDNAGNSKHASIHFAVDTTPPSTLTYELTNNTNTGDSADLATKNREPAFEGSVEKGCSVQVAVDGEIYNATIDKNGNWKCFVKKSLDDGSHDFTITAKDSAGNTLEKKDVLTIDNKNEISFHLSDGADTGISSTDFITKNNHFDIIGKTDANSTLKIVVEINGVSKTTTATSDDSGNFHVNMSDITNGDIDNGNYKITVTSTDLCGNEATQRTNIIIDTIKPSPTTIDIDESTNSANKHDNVTNIADFVMCGTAEYGCSAILKVNGSKTYDIVISENGTWTLALPTMDDGDNKFELTVTDKAGNQSTVFKTIDVDTKAPDVTGHLASSCETGRDLTDGIINKNQNIKLEGTCDHDAKLVIFIDDVAHRAVVHTDGSWIFVIPDELSDSTHHIRLEATDVAGNTNPLKEFDFTVDTTPPTITAFDLSLISDTGVKGDGVTKLKSPVFFAKGSDDIAFCELVIVGGETVKGVKGSDGNWIFKVKSLDDNVYNYHIVAEDLAGNVTTTIDKALTIDNHIDLFAALSTDSDTGFSHVDQITKCKEPKLRVNTDTGNSIVLTITNTESNTQAYYGKMVAKHRTFDWSLDNVNGFKDGVYTWKMDAVDDGGNTISKSGNFTIDTVSHVTGYLSNDSGNSTTDHITKENLQEFIGTSDGNSRITIKINGHFADGTSGIKTYHCTANQTGEWRFKCPDKLNDGDFSYTISAKDVAGNISPDDPTLNGTVTVDTSAPTIASHLITDEGVSDTDSLTSYDKSVTSGKFVRIAGGSTGNADHVIIHVWYADKGFSLDSERQIEDSDSRSYTAKVNPDGTWSLNIPDLISNHEYNVSSQSIDIAGNASPKDQFTLKYDDTLDATISLDSGSGTDTGTVGDNITNCRKPVISGTVEDSMIISSAQITGNNGRFKLNIPDFYLDDKHHFKIMLADYLDAAGLKEGDYKLVLTSSDSAGNSGTVDYDFKIDLTPPFLSPHLFNGSTGRTGVPSIFGNAEMGSTIEVCIGGKIITAKVVAPVSDPDSTVGSFTIDPKELPFMNDGLVTYTITATDTAGNKTVITDKTNIDTGTFVNGSLVAEDDTGESSTDGITQNNHPSFSGNSEPLSTITVKIMDSEGKVAFTETSSTTYNGRWTVDFFNTTIPEGKYTYVITDVDNCGNVAKTAPKKLIIDNTLTLSSLDAFHGDSDGGTTYNGERYLGANQGTFKGVVSSHDLGAIVSVSVKGEVIAQGYCDSRGRFSVSWDLADGNYDAVITVTDKAGNECTKTIKMHVDGRVSEDFTFNCPDNENKDTDSILVNTKTLKLSGDCDADDHTTVVVKLFGAKSLTIDAVVKDGHWEINQDVPDGTYSYEYIYTEKSGSNVTGRGQITIDTTNDLLTLDSFTKSDNILGHWSATTISGHAEANSNIDIVIDGTKYHTTTKDNGIWSVSANITENKTYDISIKSTDLANNVKTWNDDSHDASHSTVSLDLFDNFTTDFSNKEHIKDHVISGESIAGAKIKATFMNIMGDVETLYTIGLDDGTWKIDTSKLSQGMWKVNIAVDTNWSHMSKDYSIVVDNAPTSLMADVDADDTHFDSDVHHHKIETIVNNSDATITYLPPKHGFDMYDIYINGAIHSTSPAGSSVTVDMSDINNNEFKIVGIADDGSEKTVFTDCSEHKPTYNKEIMCADGCADANTEVLLKVGDNVIAKTTTDHHGDWSVNISNQYANDKIDIIEIQNSKHELKTAHENHHDSHVEHTHILHSDTTTLINDDYDDHNILTL